MKILLDNPEKREWGSYLRYYDLFYLKLLQKCAEHSSGKFHGDMTVLVSALTRNYDRVLEPNAAYGRRVSWNTC